GAGPPQQPLLLVPDRGQLLTRRADVGGLAFFRLAGLGAGLGQLGLGPRPGRLVLAGRQLLEALAAAELLLGGADRALAAGDRVGGPPRGPAGPGGGPLHPPALAGGGPDHPPAPRGAGQPPPAPPRDLLRGRERAP